MSYDPLPQISNPTSKLGLSKYEHEDADNDIFLHDIPSTLDLALNGTTNHSSQFYSIDKAHNGLLHPNHYALSTASSRSPSPSLSHSKWDTLASFYHTNEPLLRVALAQLFGALMNTTARLLEHSNADAEDEEEGMHPFQILFLRQGLTMMGCSAWMWWKNTGGFPFGNRGVRGLLVARSCCGFWGIFGMYYSLQYLPVADATVITFLAPSVASYGCYILFREPFPRAAQYASLVAFLGVILIAQPFSSSTVNNTETKVEAVSSAHRLLAVLFALFGVLGAAGAYTCIRFIGTRANPMININYFSSFCFLISTLVLTFSHLLSNLLSSSSESQFPWVDFAFPNSWLQWGELGFLTICGFVMQYLLTTGLGGKAASAGQVSKKGGGARATNMVYTQILFSLALDRIFWGIVPGVWSLVGGGLVLGSAVAAGVMKDGGEEAVPDEGGVEQGTGDEEMAMLVTESETEPGAPASRERRASIGSIG